MDNQEAKYDADKIDLTLVPRQIIWDMGEVRRYGVKKYKDPENWRRVSLERYRAALFRHLLAYLDDPKGKDEDSGIEHYKHVACNVAFICELEKDSCKPDALEKVTEIAEESIKRIEDVLRDAEWETME